VDRVWSQLREKLVHSNRHLIGLIAIVDPASDFCQVDTLKLCRHRIRRRRIFVWLLVSVHQSHPELGKVPSVQRSVARVRV
jgi:hypothetical protein